VTPVVLASKSVVRRRLLAAAGVPFEAAESGVDEAIRKAALTARTPEVIAETLAEAKALQASTAFPDTLVIGADQTLDVGGRLFDKAETLDQARAQLIMLRGRAHQLHTALAVARNGRVLWRETASSTLTMRAFTDAYLDAYLARNPGAALASVGCYELEGEGAQLFDWIDGDYFAILGLPLLGLLKFLREQGALPR
jgi:septum formation protein